MKRHPYLLLLLTTLCFSACTHEKTKDFKQYPATELTFEEIRIDSIMDSPRQLRIAGDSLLIINDHVEDKAVLLYNLSDSSCVRTVSIGQGPGEVLAPNWIDLAGDSLNVLSRSNGKINRYALNDLLQDKITACRTIDLKDADRFVQTDYGYIGMDFYLNDKEEVRLARAFDLMGNPVQDLDWYTEYQADDKILTYFCFQGQAGYHPGSHTLMVAPVYASTIWFYTWKDGQWEKSNSFPIGNGELERNAQKGDFTDEIRYTTKVLDICTDRDYFYYLHEDQQMKEGKTVDGCHYILRFLPDGTFDKLFKVDESVTAICPAGEVLYASFIGKDGEYTLGKTKL